MYPASEDMKLLICCGCRGPHFCPVSSAGTSTELRYSSMTCSTVRPSWASSTPHTSSCGRGGGVAKAKVRGGLRLQLLADLGNVGTGDGLGVVGPKKEDADASERVSRAISGRHALNGGL